MVSQYPLAWLMQRMPLGKFLGNYRHIPIKKGVVTRLEDIGVVIFLWAVTMMATAGCTNFTGAMINRFVLGCVEAVVT